MPFGSSAASWLRRYLAEVRPALDRRGTGALFLSARGTATHPAAALADHRGPRPPGRDPFALDAARAAPLVRDAPARARRRPPGAPDDARARRHLDDADLHAGFALAAPGRLRPVPPAGPPGASWQIGPRIRKLTRMRKAFLAAVCAAALGLAAPARAELVLFREGRVVKAAGYRVIGDELEIDVPGGGSYRVDLDRVDRILDDEVEVDETVTLPLEDDGRARRRTTSRTDASRRPLFGTAYDAMIETEARRANVDASLVSAVIRAESNFEPRSVSRKGARGLMQLMPATAKRLGVARPFDPRANIRGGVRYLRELVDRFDNRPELVLAAYNAGENAVEVSRRRAAVSGDRRVREADPVAGGRRPSRRRPRPSGRVSPRAGAGCAVYARRRLTGAVGRRRSSASPRRRGRGSVGAGSCFDAAAAEATRSAPGVPPHRYDESSRPREGGGRLLARDRSSRRRASRARSSTSAAAGPTSSRACRAAARSARSFSSTTWTSCPRTRRGGRCRRSRARSVTDSSGDAARRT